VVIRTYSVPTVSCDNCKQAIETEVGELRAVSLVEVDLVTQTVRVEGNASDETVRAAIDDAGYAVEDPMA
jgi:copper chaperone CopZ